MNKQQIWDKCKLDNAKCDGCGKQHQEVVCIIAGYEMLAPITIDLCYKCFMTCKDKNN